MKKIVLLICLALLSGCVGDALQSNTPPAVRYLVHPAKMDMALEKETIIRVDKVIIAEALETDRIAALEEQRRLHYLEQARWTAPLDKVLQRYIAESLETIENVTIIHEDAARIKADYRLRVDMSDVYAMYDAVAGQGTPKVRTKGTLMLLNAEDSSIISTLDFDEIADAKGNSATEIVQAFEAQWGRLITQLTQNLAPPEITR